MFFFYSEELEKKLMAMRVQMNRLGSIMFKIRLKCIVYIELSEYEDGNSSVFESFGPFIL